MAYNPLLEEYVRYMEDLTEAPPQFHAMMFYVMIGMAVGKKAYVATPMPLYPNFFVVLVGESGQTRKTTTMRLMRYVLTRIHRDIGWISHLGSLEGLYEYLIDKPRTVIAPEEFVQLIEKSQGYTSNLMPGITELYDVPPRIQRILANRQYEVENPFVSVVTGTTIEWLNRIKDEDVYAGFGNRFLYVYGETDKIIPYPKPLTEEYIKPLVKQIRSVLQWFYNQSKLHGVMRYDLDDEAKKIYERFYRRFKALLLGGVQGAAIRRIDDYVKKIALINAISNEHTVITGDDIYHATEIGKLLIDDAFKCFGERSLDFYSKLERKILKALKEKPGGATKKELMKSIENEKGSYGLKEKVLHGLVRAGIVERKGGRYYAV